MTDIECIDYYIDALSSAGSEFDEVTLNIRATVELVTLLQNLKEKIKE